MKNKIFLIIVIAILILLNLGTLGFIWFHRPGEEPRQRRPDASRFLFRELNLSKQQREEFFLIRNDYRQKMEQIQQHDKELHNRFFDLLRKDSVDPMTVEMLADSIAQIRKIMEIFTFEHFMAMKQKLNPEQKKKFDMVFHKTIRMILPPPITSPPGK